MADIKRLFTPEFRNRLDATVSFKALDEQIILRVVDKFLLQLETQLAEKKVEVTFTDKLRKHLAKKGFDPLMGARPMQRLIQDTIRRALADELLFGRLHRRWPPDGGHRSTRRGRSKCSSTSSRCPRRKARPSRSRKRFPPTSKQSPTLGQSPLNRIGSEGFLLAMSRRPRRSAPALLTTPRAASRSPPSAVVPRA